MNKLIGFIPSASPFIIESDFLKEKSVLTIHYFLQNTDDIKGLNQESYQYKDQIIPRKNELWQTTCFELFLNPIGKKNYYEFNFSLLPTWNCYGFESYRQPEIPKENFDFTLAQFAWDRTKKMISITLENHSQYDHFHVGITAVVEDKIGNKNYFALKHCSEKPDFHILDSFILERK